MLALVAEGHDKEFGRAVGGEIDVGKGGFGCRSDRYGSSAFILN